jgi:lysine-specific demethylase 3
MDMADAFNVMLYASNCADGSPGYAIWDLFHAEDSDKIREFLRKKFTSRSVGLAKGQQHTQTEPEKATALPIQVIADHDPIHIQHFYLDVELRRQLWDEYGVKSYRIYQRPGEGVFIPTGCAHQVCFRIFCSQFWLSIVVQVANMADCMKIAVDFVSPENIDRCEKLTKEFREQNQKRIWKEDVLQLRTMMWFAWQSCTKKESELNEQETLNRVGLSSGNDEAMRTAM